MKKFEKIVVLVIIVGMICGSATAVKAAIDLSPYTDAEMLGRYIDYEGGELHERLLIAETLLSKVTEEITLKDVLNFYTFKQEDAWDSMLSNYDEINTEIARLAIENHENGRDLQYNSYMFKDWYLASGYVITEDCLETEHYVFFSTN